MGNRRKKKLANSNVVNPVTGEVTKVRNTKLEAFKKKHGRGPATDSELDQVYGKGAADQAYALALYGKNSPKYRALYGKKKAPKKGPRNRRQKNRP
tara:strand:- start:115 stop:402 length:288 start_codon:yes stop_codon:yes gene_type:complete